MLNLLFSLVAIQSSTFLGLESFEGTTASEVEGASWQEFTIGTALDPAVPWSHVRGQFDLGAAATEGRWLLRMGGGDLRIQARLNGQILLPISDPASDRTEVRSGPLFAVPHSALQESDNQLALKLSGEHRDLERGPAFLLSPDLADRFLATLRAPREWRVANDSTLATFDAEGRSGARILFRDGAHDGEFRLGAQLDLTMTQGARSVEPASFAVRTPMPRFPISSLNGQDPLHQHLKFRHSLFAPIGVETERLARAKVVLGTLGNQRVPQGQYEFDYVLRMFPGRGGTLRVEKGDDFLLLHNGVVGLFAEDAEVVGSPEQPVGLTVQLAQGTAGAVKSAALMGPSSIYGVFVYEGSLKGKRNPTILAAAADLLSRAKTLRNETGVWSRELGTFPDLDAEHPTEPALRAITGPAAANPSRYAPRKHTDAAATPGWQFWASELILLRRLEREREAIDAALQPPADAEAHDPELRLLYAVLRAIRQHEWTYDGEWFSARVPRLMEIVEQHAPSSVHATALRATAVSGLRRILPEIGRSGEANRLELVETQLTNELFSASGTLWPVSGDADGSKIRALGEVLLLQGAPAEHRQPMIEWVLKQTAPEDSLAALLQLRLALVEGRVEQWTGVLSERMQDALVTDWFDDNDAALYGVLLFGYCGVRRTAVDVIEIAPRSNPAKLTVQAPVHDGIVNVNLGKPDRQLLRLMQLNNKTSVPLTIRLGIPGRFGTGKKIKVGELDFSIYEFELEPGRGERRQVR